MRLLVTRIVLAAWCLGVPWLHSHIASAETLQERVAAAQRRWAEYQELMGSSDPVARSEGFNAALSDENLGVRNNALWSYLQRHDRLPVEVVVDPGGQFGPGDAPKTAVLNVKWNAEQRTLQGQVISFGQGGVVGGEVIAGKLQLHYGTLWMPKFVGQTRDAASAQADLVARRCDVALTVNSTRDAMEGRLSCETMPQTIPVRLPLG